MRNKILLVCMILGSFAAVNKSYASDKPTPGYNEVISDYISSYMNANYKMLDKILGESATVKMPRADAVMVHTRSMLLEQMKGEAGSKQNCGSDYKVLDKNEAMVVAKVDFKYNDFIQHNYLVLERDENKEWKITQVCKFFEEVKAKVNNNQQPAPSVTASAGK